MTPGWVVEEVAMIHPDKLRITQVKQMAMLLLQKKISLSGNLCVGWTRVLDTALAVDLHLGVLNRPKLLWFNLVAFE